MSGLLGALRFRQLRLHGAVLVVGLFLNLCAAFGLSASTKGLVMNSSQQVVQSVSEFLVLRNEAFEQRRKVFFGDATLLKALKAQELTGDPVEAFLARALVQWATEGPASVRALEEFIMVEAPQRTRDNRKAGSAGNELALLRLASQQSDPQQALDYLMLRALTRPSESELAFDALASLYSKQAPREVQAWIRMAVENGTEPVAIYLVEQSLPLIASPVVESALDSERARLMRVGKQLPAALEQYRTKSAVR